MSNFFDQFDESQQRNKSNFFDKFDDATKASPEEKGTLSQVGSAFGAGIDKMQELGYRAVKGFTDVGVPQEEQTNALGRAIGQGGSLSRWLDEGIARNIEEQKAYTPSVASYKDIDSIGDAASYVGEMTAQSVPMMATALSPAGLLAMGGGLSNEAYEAQPEDNKQPWRATASGFGQAGLERLGVETAIGRVFGGEGKKFVKRVGQSMLGEGVTETGQEALAQWGSGKSLDEIENLDEAFVGGALVGGTIRTGTEAGKAAYDKYRGERPELSDIEETDLTQSASSAESVIPDPFADIGPAQDQAVTGNEVEIIPGETAGDTQPNWQFGQNDMPYRGQVTPYIYDGEYEQYREAPNSVPVGAALEAPIIDGEFERPRGLPNRADTIIGEDGRPMQQAQEFADSVGQASNRALPFDDVIYAPGMQPEQVQNENAAGDAYWQQQQARSGNEVNRRQLEREAQNYQGAPALPQKDIIYGEDGRNVQIKRNGQPFGGRRAAELTKEFRQAKEQGLNPQVIKVNGGYGWVSEGDNVGLDTGSIEQSSDLQVGSAGIALPRDVRGDNGGRLRESADGTTGTGDAENIALAARRDTNDDALNAEAEEIPTSEGAAELGAGSQLTAIDAAANEAATSPTNDRPEPTEAQKEAGNYKKGKVRLHGLDISIENPKGSTRKGKDQDGKEWSSEMKHHYGDIKGTTGADGDSIDVFIGDKPESQKVFVVDQIDPKTGEFDEVKVMMGFDDAEAAKSGYLSNYDKNWKGLGEITEASVEDFKAWTKRPRKSKQPFAQELKIKNAEALITKKGKEASKAKLTDEPKILSITESAWVKSEIKRLALKNGSPGYDAAVSKIKDSYDDNYDEAIATVSFERYKELNPDTPESILRKSYDSIKNTAVENGDASFRAADNGNVSTAGNSGSVSRADADKVIGDIIRSWSGGVKARRNEFFVASTFNELPNDIKEAAKKQGAEGKVYGVFHNGKTYVVLDKHRSTKEVETTIFHETYGHHGMRKLFGADINRKMNNLYTAIGGMSGLRKAAKNHGVNLDIYIRGADKAKIPQELRNRVLMEELLAHIQQDNRPSVKRLAKELIGAIRQKLRDIGFAELSNVSDSDLFHILKQSRDAVKKGATQTGDARFMLDDKGASVDSEMSSEPTSFRVGEEGNQSENKLMESAKQKLGLKENEAKSIVSKVKEAWKDVNYTEAKNRVKEGLFDSLYGIKKAEDAQNVSLEKSGYVSARLAQGVGDVIHATMFYGSPEWRDGIVQKKEGTKGLLDIFSQLDSSELNDWLAWMGGNRANVLMKQGRENNLNKSEIEELQSLNSGREELFNKVKEEYNAANAAVLKLAIESGLLDSDVMNKFESEWYVPFFRAEDPTDINEVIKGPTSPNGIANASAQIKTLKGGEQSTKDILQNILQRQATLIDASMKNKAMLEVAGNLDGTPFMKKVKLNKIQIDAITKKRLAKKATPYVSVNENGETQWYEVLEPSLLRALMQLNVKRSDNPLMKLSRAAKRYLTTGVTLSPTFIIRNYLRDGVHGWMINKDKFVFGLDSVKGAVKTWKKDQSTIDLMFAGASFQGGYVHANDPEQGAQQIRRALRKKGLSESAISKYMASIPKGAGQFFEKYRDFSDSMENANRVSTYDASLKANKSKKQSAFEARDFMDFGLQGNFSAMQFMTDVIPFLNARMQGLYKLYRSGKAGEGESFAKVLSKELAIKGMYVASFSLALALYNMDDERYEELPDWDKDANWHFFNGETHIRIPKPFELGVIFGTVPERLFMRTMGKQNNKDLERSMTHAVTSTLAMNPFPQIIKPGFEVWANYDFFSGRPIDSFSDQFKRPQDRYSMYTTETAKIIGDAFGASPQKIEHLVRGYAGTLGSYVLSSADIIGNSFATATGKGEFKINEFDDLSLIRAFVKTGEVGGTYYGEQFYDTLQEINSLYKQYVNANQEQDEEAAEEILKEGASKLEYRSMFNKTQAYLNKLNHQRNVVWKDTSIPLKEREKIVDDINREKNAVYRYVVLEYRKMND